MAYTYHIFCKPTQQHYYGAKYAKDDCNPTNLGITYLSSSVKVKNLIEMHGIDNFTFQVRKVFDDGTPEENAKKALEWEQCVLRRLNVLHRDDWINSSIGTTHRSMGPKSEEHKRKIGEGNKGKKIQPESIEKTRRKNLGRKASQETKAKFKAVRQDLVWLSNESTQSTRLVHSYEVESLLSEGWVRGRLYFKKLTHHSEETKKRWSETRRGVAQPNVSKARKGKVSAVAPDGSFVYLTSEEFRQRPDLVGVASAEGKRRRGAI